MIELNGLNTVDEYGVGYGAQVAPNTTSILGSGTSIPKPIQPGIKPEKEPQPQQPTTPLESLDKYKDFDEYWNSITANKPPFMINIMEKSKEFARNEFENRKNPPKDDALKQIEDDQQKLWDREDKIRKKTQEREDNAYQRSVKDMIASGINPNLLGVSPAGSGGGITQASKKDYSHYEKNQDRLLKAIMQTIEHEFKGSEADKDRFIKSMEILIGTSLRAIGK